METRGLSEKFRKSPGERRQQCGCAPSFVGASGLREEPGAGEMGAHDAG
jgi:hypothetical protein